MQDPRHLPQGAGGLFAPQGKKGPGLPGGGEAGAFAHALGGAAGQAQAAVEEATSEEAASEEAATELAAAEEAVEAEPPQAVRARAAAETAAAARKLRREIFFIFKHSSVDCIIFHFPGTMRFIVSSRNRISICCTNKKVKCCAKIPSN